VRLHTAWGRRGGAADNGTIRAHRGMFPFAQMAKVQLRACLQSLFWPCEPDKQGRGITVQLSSEPHNAPIERLLAHFLSIADRLLMRLRN